MQLQFQHTEWTRGRPSKSALRKKSKQNAPKMLILLIVVLVIGIVMSAKEFWELDDDGNPQLTQWRQEKLDKELEELENAEQYALIALRAGEYTCYNCGDEATIFLYPTEVWKYGVTTKGKDGRYREGLPNDGLLYRIQFRGTLQECFREEKLKIYRYAILPENQKRAKPIMRPPGNKVDR